ncbi:biotin holocarboxylase synthetase, partial [Spiromyces aspiralis]
MSIGHDPKPRGLNILVYSGDGAGPDSISHAINTLQAFLGHNYAVRKADAQLLKTEPWESSTALIVFPGGRDKPYVRDLGDDGVARLREWVINGGRYIGFCAGGYFGSSRCEFEPNTALEVIGDRKLRFYPGTCLGAAYPGYNYTSHDGARA